MYINNRKYSESGGMQQAYLTGNEIRMLSSWNEEHNYASRDLNIEKLTSD